MSAQPQTPWTTDVVGLAYHEPNAVRSIHIDNDRLDVDQSEIIAASLNRVDPTSPTGRYLHDQIVYGDTHATALFPAALYRYDMAAGVACIMGDAHRGLLTPEDRTILRNLGVYGVDATTCERLNLIADALVTYDQMGASANQAAIDMVSDLMDTLRPALTVALEHATEHATDALGAFINQLNHLPESTNPALLYDTYRKFKGVAELLDNEPALTKAWMGAKGRHGRYLDMAATTPEHQELADMVARAHALESQS